MYNYTEKINKLKESIAKAEKHKQNIINITQKLLTKVQNRTISQEEYHDELSFLLQNKSPNDWINYYDNYINSCIQHLAFYKNQIKKQKIKITVALSVLFFISLILLSIILPLLKQTTISPVELAPPTDDFRIQRGSTIIPAAATTATITAGIDYQAPSDISKSFIRIVSTRLSGVGHDAGGGTQNPATFMTSISNPGNLLTDITFERYNPSASFNTRVYWEIIEYVGNPGDGNEIIVRNQEQIEQLSGTTFSGAPTPGIVDDNKAVVFITGQRHSGTQNGATDRGLYTSEFLFATDTPQFTRGDPTGTSSISYAVVEFIGANWQIQRAEHVYTASGVDEIETITPINALNRAFIHPQIRTATGGLDEQGQRVFINALDQLTFTLRAGAAVSQTGVAWIIENTQTAGTPMNVQRISGTRPSGGTEPDQFTETISPISSLAQASIFGETADSSGAGTAVPRGSFGIDLTALDTVTLWRSDTGQSQDYRFEVVEWPIAPLSNLPPTTPSDILCDSLVDCDITIDAAIDIEGIGSTDPETDPITYFLEALLDTTKPSGDIEPGTIQYQGTVGGIVNTPIHFAGFESGPQGWAFGTTGSESFRDTIQNIVDDSNNPGGAFAAHIRDDTPGESLISQSFDFTGFDSIQIDFNSFENNFNGAEFVTLSCDSTEIFRMTNGDQPEDTWVTQSVTATPADCVFDSSATLEFTGVPGLSGNGDHWHIDGIDIQGISTALPDLESTKPYTTYNNIFSVNTEIINNIEVTISVTQFDNSGSVQNANNNPDLELEMFDGSAFIPLGPFTITSPGVYTIQVTNPTVLTAWQSSVNTNLRVRGINFDFFDATNFDDISFDTIVITLNGRDWTAIGSHASSTPFVWDTSLIPDQLCVDLRANAIDLTGSNIFSSYFTKNSCLNIQHAAPNNPPTIVSIGPIPPVDLTAGTTTDVTFQFTAEDLDGAADLDDATATAQFSRVGEATRTDPSCAFVSELGNQRTYSCTITLSYYDDNGIWDVTADIQDLSTAPAQSTSTFTVNLLRDITLSPVLINFPIVAQGATNIIAVQTTQVTNNGNFDPGIDGPLSITAADLTGETTPAEIIPAANFRVAGSSDAATVCSSGSFLINGIPAPISSLNPPRGPAGSNTDDLSYCLTLVPPALSSQFYSATVSSGNAWTITTLSVLFTLKGKRKRKKKKKRKEYTPKVLNNLLTLDSKLKADYGLGVKKLIQIAKNKKTIEKNQKIKISIEVFNQSLSPAEALSKYLKENKSLKHSEISSLINRNQRTIWVNYHNAIKKMKEKIKIKKSTIRIPINKFSNRKLSISESLVLYLKQKDLRNIEISDMLNKDPRNIFTLYSRAKNKLRL